ncbi:MAG: flagellar basal body-associated FliL family protein [Acidobacteriota bacterium]|nr:flagellar basal body-associated FliL family protein [Acidobacteriota bacterium]
MAKEDAAAPAAAKSGSNPWKMISMVLVVLVLVAGAGGAGFWWSRRGVAAEAKVAPAAAAVPAVGKGIVSFQPFLANLADPGGNRFLRTSVQLVVPTAAEGDEISKDDVTVMRLRSAILELLTEQTADQLVTPKGKDVLKKAIKDRATQILGTVPVVDVLFSDFVVQF